MIDELKRVAAVAANYLEEIDQRIDHASIGMLPAPAAIAKRLRDALEEEAATLRTVANPTLDHEA